MISVTVPSVSWITTTVFVVACSKLDKVINLLIHQTLNLPIVAQVSVLISRRKVLDGWVSLCTGFVVFVFLVCHPWWLVLFGVGVNFFAFFILFFYQMPKPFLSSFSFIFLIKKGKICHTAQMVAVENHEYFLSNYRFVHSQFLFKPCGKIVVC